MSHRRYRPKRGEVKRLRQMRRAGLSKAGPVEARRINSLMLSTPCARRRFVERGPEPGARRRTREEGTRRRDEQSLPVLRLSRQSVGVSEVDGNCLSSGSSRARSSGICSAPRTPDRAPTRLQPPACRRRSARRPAEWLGHAGPGFTLRTYVQLPDEALGDADFLGQAVTADPSRVNVGSTEGPQTAGNTRTAESADMAL